MSIICERCGHRNGEAPSPASAGPSSPLRSSSTPQLRANLQSVNLEILRHQTYISELTAKRDTLELKLAETMYPILSLPPELTARIFVQCLPAHGRVQPSPTAPPLLLAQICRDWREIALGTSEIWSSVDVAFTRQDTTEAKEGAVFTIETWLSRAKGQPLSLTVRSQGHAIPSPIISLICVAAPQIHTLEVELSSYEFDILKQKQVAFPGLQRLALVSKSRVAHESWAPSISIMQHASSLTNLTIDTTPISLLSPSLTALEIRHRIPFSSLLDLFRQCPKLLDLTVYVEHPGRLEDQPPITLPHLHSLAIQGLTHLEFLTLPALRRLILDGGEYEDPYNKYGHLPAWIQRWRCALEHLTLDFDYAEESRLPEVLRAVPSLTSLTVDVQYDMHSFTQVLAKDTALVPQLAALRVSAEHLKFDYLAFTQLLRERRAPLPGRVRLAFARLDLRSDDELRGTWWLSPSAIIEFDKLVAQGLEVQVTCVDGNNLSYFWPKRSSVDLCESFP
ncbi:hypothetical protein C8R47DRAFT_1127792 [Mycena vitilis]|nr:hypothetical protein C8R47DRAFT_1127792 [Mycena vitilis]